MNGPSSRTQLPIGHRLYRVARLLLAYGTPDGVLTRFLHAICEDLQADAGYLVVRRQTGFEPIAAVRYRLDDSAELSVSSTAVRQVLRQQRPLLVDDVRRSPWLQSAQSITVAGLHSLACVPILMQQHALAALYIETRQNPRPFPADTLQFLTEAAELCAGVLKRRMEIAGTDWIPSDAPVPLTPQEERIARFLPAGLTNREIAAELNISRETVKAHLQHIYAKLGVRTRSAAVYRLTRRDEIDKKQDR
jgi:DNA-binding CsgD family transcriptional regulator